MLVSVTDNFIWTTSLDTFSFLYFDLSMCLIWLLCSISFPVSSSPLGILCFPISKLSRLLKYSIVSSKYFTFFYQKWRTSNPHSEELLMMLGEEFHVTRKIGSVVSVQDLGIFYILDLDQRLKLHTIHFYPNCGLCKCFYMAVAGYWLRQLTSSLLLLFLLLPSASNSVEIQVINTSSI